MASENLAFEVYDVSLFFGNVVPEEILNPYFSQKAYALAVFFFGVGQTVDARDVADFAFQKRADWKGRALKLPLRYQGEKIRLVLARVWLP